MKCLAPVLPSKTTMERISRETHRLQTDFLKMQPKKKPNWLLNKQLKAEKCPFEMGRVHSAACGSLKAASVLLQVQQNPGLALGAAPAANSAGKGTRLNLALARQRCESGFLSWSKLQTLQTQASCSWKLTASDERNLSLLFYYESSSLIAAWQLKLISWWRVWYTLAASTSVDDDTVSRMKSILKYSLVFLILNYRSQNPHNKN